MTSIVPPKIYEILKKVVTGNIDDFTVSVHDPNKKGEGYLGEMFFVSLQDKFNGKQMNLVVKQAFSEDNVRKCYPIRDVFLNEIYFYTKLWPKFAKFQEKVSLKYNFLQVPRCYLAISEEHFERLALENLKYQGFEMHNKKTHLNKNMYEFIFRLYGRLHAISFAYQDLNPKEFAELAKGVTNTWAKFYNKEHFRDVIKITWKSCTESLQVGIDNAVIEKFKKCIDNSVEAFGKNLERGRYDVILHGDCWSNNMMFKYDDRGKLVDVKFLDFQMIKLGSPVTDLSYCLYSGGTKETFDQLDNLLQIYHDSLSESLRAYGCDPNNLYPLEAIKKEWKSNCQLGVTMALMIWRVKMTYADDVIDLVDISNIGDGADMSKFFDSKYDEKAFKERTRDVLLHLYENDFMYG